jgi:alcohol dehydrogenase class IV
MKDIIVRPGALNEILSILNKYNISNIFLVRGKNSFDISGSKDAIKNIYKKYNIVEFKDFSVNPNISDAEMGYELFKKSNSDCIIAIGGGSSIDMGKLIKYLSLTDKDHQELVNIPLIAVPTTAGTGSEATNGAVVYIKGIKHSWTHKLLLPDSAIIDSNLLQGQSSYQITVSGLDAFAQAIESFWSINSTLESIEFSKKAIQLIWNNLGKSVMRDPLAMEEMAKGAHISGKAINITQTTGAHALSYGFTSYLGIPHGHAVSLFLPYFISKNRTLKPSDCKDPRGIDHINEVISAISKLVSKKENQNLEDNIIDFYKNLGIKINFNLLGISHLEYLNAIKVYNEVRLRNDPYMFKQHDIEAIYNFNNSKNT